MIKMEDEEFWGHPVKNGSDKKPAATQGDLISLSEGDPESIVRVAAESGQQEAKEANEGGSASGFPQKVPEDRTTAESENSENEDEKSDSASEESAGDSGKDYKDEDDEYSEEFETSDGTVDEEGLEDKVGAKYNPEEDHINRAIAERLKPQIEERKRSSDKTKLPSSSRSLPKRTSAKATKKSPYSQKSLLTPRSKPTQRSQRIQRPKTYVAVTTGEKSKRSTEPKPFSFAASTNGAATLDPTKRLRTSALRNEVDYLKKQLMESKNENRTLKQIQRRQELALARLDTNRTAVPTLVERQAEEIRVAKEQLRIQKEKQRELERVLKERDDRLMHALDKMKRLEKELKERGGEHRLQAGSDTEALTRLLEEKNTRIQDLESHISLLVKNHKHQLNIEIMRHKETHMKLRQVEATRQDYKLGKSTKANRLKDDTGHVAEAVVQVQRSKAPKEETIKSITSDRRESEQRDILAETRDVIKSLKLDTMKNLTGTGNSGANLNSGKTYGPVNENTGTGRRSIDGKEERSVNIEYVRKVGHDRRSSEVVFAKSTVDKTENAARTESSLEDPWTRSERRISNPGKSTQSPAWPAANQTQTANSTQAIQSKPLTATESKKALDSKIESNVSSILDDILPIKSTAADSVSSLKEHRSPGKDSDEFLDSLFDPQIAPSKSKIGGTVGKEKSDEDSGFVNSLDSTPKQVQSAKAKEKTKSKSFLLDDDLFSTGKTKTTANGLFPWEEDAVKG